MPSPEEALGARKPAGTVHLVLFVPSVDRDAVPIDQAFWREEALRVLGTLFRGATAFPPGRGVWRDDERGGALVFDDTVLVTSYAAEQDCHEAAWRQLRAFLHRMGRDARQGEIGLVLDGKYLGIDRYDPEP